MCVLCYNGLRFCYISVICYIWLNYANRFTFLKKNHWGKAHRQLLCFFCMYMEGPPIFLNFQSVFGHIYRYIYCNQVHSPSNGICYIFTFQLFISELQKYINKDIQPLTSFQQTFQKWFYFTFYIVKILIVTFYFVHKIEDTFYMVETIIDTFYMVSTITISCKSEDCEAQNLKPWCYGFLQNLQNNSSSFAAVKTVGFQLIVICEHVFLEMGMLFYFNISFFNKL